MNSLDKLKTTPPQKTVFQIKIHNFLINISQTRLCRFCPDLLGDIDVCSI